MDFGHLKKRGPKRVTVLGPAYLIEMGILFILHGLFVGHSIIRAQKKTDTARRILNIPFPTGCRMRFYLVPQQPLVYDKVSHYIKLPHTFFISH